MPKPNLAPGPADLARLIERVENLERKLRTSSGDGGFANLPPDNAAGDELWELAGGTLQPVASLVADGSITGLIVELEAPDGDTDLHHTYLYVVPGIGGGGGDIQAETYIVGHDAVMDFFFWSRSGGTFGGIEAGAFLDAIGDDLAGVNPEAFFEVYSEGRVGTIELYADSDVTSDIEFDLVGDADNDLAYAYFQGRNAFIRFERDGFSGPFNVAPDAQLSTGDWSIGYDGTDIILKVNDGGTIKTVVLTPT